MSKGLTLLLMGALMAVSAGLAGCMGEDDPPAPTAADADADAAQAGNVTVDDGTVEMPKDVGEKPHAHDYWSGKERVTLLDEDVSVDAFSGAFFTFFNVFGTHTPALGGAYLELPEGVIVYEGTGKLEFTATWTDPAVTGMTMRYRSAASADFSEPLPVTSGAPVSVDVTPEMSDMPHGKTSRWAFLLTPAAGQAMLGSFHAKVDVLRMRDIETFPGHPDLFGGQGTLAVYDGPSQSKGQSFPGRLADALVNGFQAGAPQGVRAQKVVPMETMTMTANVTITSVTGALGKTTGVYFLYKPADSNGFEWLRPIATDAATGTYQFAWPVDMAQTDSPYAAESQWAFDVRVTSDPTGLGLECGGCADTTVDYVLTVVAYDALLDGVELPEDEDEGDR